MKTLTERAALSIRIPAIFTLLIAIQLSFLPLYAEGNGTSVGLTLTGPTGARPAALGEAFTAVPDTIESLGYNPASLATLSSPHASFMYEKGLADDAYGQFMVGLPLNASGVGLSVGYYNGGDMDAWDGEKDVNVTAKQDLTANIGYAKKVSALNVGIAGTYISSELVEEKTATAYAVDMGLLLSISERLHVGVAIQNIGTKMKYVEESYDLPQIGRVGVMISPIKSLNLLLDAPYYMNESEVRPQVGVEYGVGPMALRAGYQSQRDLNQFTFGAGFNLGKLTLDYAYGLVEDLDASHRASLSMRFGGETSQPIAREERPPEREVREVPSTQVQFVETPKPTETELMQARSLGNQIYEVKPGDTLGKIAKRMYGDAGAWRRIYAANQHLLNDERTIEIGQRIVLP